MRALRPIAAASICLALSAQTSVIVYQVKIAAMSGDLNTARQELKLFRDSRGAKAAAVPEYIEALSWLGRGELRANQFAAAEETAGQVRKLCLDKLSARRLDADASLAAALGASIETQALAAALTGRRDQAVGFLREELKRWHDTSVRARIQKNLNLLTLEGKPAPPIEVAQGLTGPKPRPLAQHAGHPVLLFFWAHWCSDCKAEIAVVQRLQQKYGPRGFEVVAPTQHYGYVAGGQEAPREVETAYMRAVFGQYYSGLGRVETPVGEETFANYGVSTTPTLVLVDKAGIVRVYSPGNLTYEQLAGKIEGLIK